jgi:hypothetical protein
MFFTHVNRKSNSKNVVYCGTERFEEVGNGPRQPIYSLTATADISRSPAGTRLAAGGVLNILNSKQKCAFAAAQRSSSVAVSFKVLS